MEAGNTDDNAMEDALENDLVRVNSTEFEESKKPASEGDSDEKSRHIGELPQRKKIPNARMELWIPSPKKEQSATTKIPSAIFGMGIKMKGRMYLQLLLEVLVEGGLVGEVALEVVDRHPPLGVDDLARFFLHR